MDKYGLRPNTWQLYSQTTTSDFPKENDGSLLSISGNFSPRSYGLSQTTGSISHVVKAQQQRSIPAVVNHVPQ